MDFELLSEITQIESIARGAEVQIHSYLNHKYAGGRRIRWRKLKGIAWIGWLTPEKRGKVEKAELHWFEGVRDEAVRQFTGKSSSGRELNH